MVKKDKIRLMKKEIKEEDWRNEHGQPSLEFLKSLAAEGSPKSLEKLRAIAQDLDVSYSSEASNEELIDKILAEIRSDPTVTA